MYVYYSTCIFLDAFWSAIEAKLKIEKLLGMQVFKQIFGVSKECTRACSYFPHSIRNSQVNSQLDDSNSLARFLYLLLIVRNFHSVDVDAEVKIQGLKGIIILSGSVDFY